MDQDVTTKFNMSREAYRGHLELVNVLAPKLVEQGYEVSLGLGDLEKFLNALGKVRIKDTRTAVRAILQGAEPDLVDAILPVAYEASEIVTGANNVGEKLADLLELAQELREVPHSEIRFGDNVVSALEMAQDIEDSALFVIECIGCYHFPDASKPLIRVLPNPDSEAFRYDIHTEQFAAISKVLDRKLTEFFKVFDKRGYTSDMADDMHDLLCHFANNAAEEQYLDRTSQLFDVLSFARQRQVFIEESELRGTIVDHPILSRFAGTNEQLDEQVKAARDIQQGGYGLPERLRHLDV
ncbi:MAG: hypothetical protein RBR86_07155 [Pseudobdellovibrionaceae bacterium]|jgi:hypothetical protein|nr:hypothetical protein [Pseudobdellovibrionaceae bacterium]